MKNFDSRTYSINDFREWDSRKELELQPKFQRRSVWSDKARSYLMDSIVRGKPIPKIFIRQDIDPKTKKTVRDVVDGQQRLRTILGFLQDGFKMAKAHSAEYGGKFYSEFPDDVQTAILKYELSVDLLLDAPDKEVLDIFARLNSYAVKLNPQELRNATYFGEFKTLTYFLALEYVSFWTTNKIFTDAKILRMDEAELASDLLVALLDGIKSRKSIDSYYKKHDDELKEKVKLSQHFRKTMDTIGALSNGALPNTPFTSPVLFYSLFCAIHHHLHGLPKMQLARRPFKESQYPKVWSALESVEAIIKNQEPGGAEAAFVDSLKRHTTDEPVRQVRTEFLIKLIAKRL
ncbi:MAG: hypothetical protein JWQ71_3778 [Pedosphaera sp.]|nr:hypothetical protein [Pedosphaera sp.]